jgi:hypothetical protein
MRTKIGLSILLMMGAKEIFAQKDAARVSYFQNFDLRKKKS